MKQRIDIEISEDIPEERHESLRKAVYTLLDYVRPEYLAWLKFNEEPVLIENKRSKTLGEMKTGLLGNKMVTLSPSLFDRPILQQIIAIEEEIIHMIDAHTGFSQSPKFREAVHLDIEDLNTKTLLAVSRIWHGFLKAMPTGDDYSALSGSILYKEALPDILAASRFLIEAEPESLDTRKQEFSRRFTECLRATYGEKATNEYLENYANAGGILAFAFEMAIRLVLGFYDRLPQDASQQEAIQLFKSMEKAQSQQIDEIEEYCVKLILNIDEQSAIELLQEFLPTLHPYATRFSEMAKNTADFFEKYPDWAGAFSYFDAQGVKEMLQQGVSMDALDFVLRHDISDLARSIVTATLDLHQNGIPSEYAVIDSVIDGKNLAQRMNIAAAGENYELAALFKKALGEHKGY